MATVKHYHLPNAAMQTRTLLLTVLLFSSAATGCAARASYDAARIEAAPDSARFEVDGAATDRLDAPRGKASWYGADYQGRPTASGEPFNMYAFTAAHRTLPFGSWVMVTRTDNAAWTIVRITDRGPFIAGRIIDLSWAAATELGMVEEGVVPVQLELLRER